MIDVKLREIVELALGQTASHIDRNGNVRFYCPFCHHHKQKLEVNLDPNSGRTKKGNRRFQSYHCWVCGASGNSLYHLFMAARAPRQSFIRLASALADGHVLSGNYTIEQALALLEDQYDVTESIALPEETVSLLAMDRLTPRQAEGCTEFLSRRKISAYDIARYNIGFCPSGDFQNRIIIPSYASHGALNYFVGRSIFAQSKKKYKNPEISKDIVVFERFINWNEPIVIVEGVFDAITVRFNAIPLLGKTLSPRLEQKLSVFKPQVTICLDDDIAHGEAAAIAEYTIKNGCNTKIAQLEGKDPNEVGHVSAWKAIRNAKKITFETMIEYKCGGEFE